MPHLKGAYGKNGQDSSEIQINYQNFRGNKEIYQEMSWSQLGWQNVSTGSKVMEQTKHLWVSKSRFYGVSHCSWTDQKTNFKQLKRKKL